MQERPTTPRDELVAALYAAAADAVPQSKPLELLAELTRSDKAFSAHYDFEKRRGSILASFNVEPHNIDSYREIYAAQNPWLARASYFQAEGLVWRGSEILDLARLRETEFYKLFLYGQVIEHTAHLVVRVRGSELHHIVLTRRRDAEDYSDSAIDICRNFTHHARHALEVGEAAAKTRFIEEGLSAAADEVTTGIAVVQAPSTILHMNQTFATLIAGGRPPSQAPWRPPGFERPAQRRFADTRLPRALMDALAEKPVPGSCIIPAASVGGQRPLAVLIRPFQLRVNPSAPASSGFVLLCRSSDAQIELDETALRSAYTLTAAEARVCTALIGGENVHVLSAALGISPQTARTHLKRIFDKTSTTRQPELLRILMSFAHRRKPKAPVAVPTDARNLLVPGIAVRRPDKSMF